MRATSPPSVMVVGAGRVATAAALSLSKAGRRVVLCVRNDTIRSLLSVDRAVPTSPGRTTPLPPNVSFVDGKNSDAVGESLTQCAAVWTAVPSVSVIEALEPFSEAMKKNLCSSTVGVASSETSSAADLPVMVMARGLTSNGALVSTAVQQTYPHVRSVYSILPPPYLSNWLATAAAALPGTGSAKNTPGQVFEKSATPGALWVFPSLHIGATSSASLRSREAVCRVLQPTFGVTWEPDVTPAPMAARPIAPSNPAAAVDFAGATCVAAGFVAGLISGRAGANPTLTLGGTQNVVAAANRGLVEATSGMTTRLGASATVAISATATDADGREHKFGRTLVNTTSAEYAAKQLFIDHTESPHYASLESTLLGLGSIDRSFFQPLSETGEGVRRASTVAETIGTSTVDWDRPGDLASTLSEATKVMDEGLMSGKMDAARRKAQSILEGDRKNASAAAEEGRLAALFSQE